MSAKALFNNTAEHSTFADPVAPRPSNIKLLHSHSRRSYGGSGEDWTTERRTAADGGRSKSESTGAFYLDTPTYVRATRGRGFLEEGSHDI